jgi:hypothetical protein
MQRDAATRGGISPTDRGGGETATTARSALPNTNGGGDTNANPRGVGEKFRGRSPTRIWHHSAHQLRHGGWYGGMPQHVRASLRRTEADRYAHHRTRGSIQHQWREEARMPSHIWGGGNLRPTRTLYHSPNQQQPMGVGLWRDATTREGRHTAATTYSALPHTGSLRPA